MSILEYRDIWEQTDKAVTYLRKKGADYFTVPVKTGCGDFRLIAYTFADVGDKARNHVAKSYPNALVAFADADSVAAAVRDIDARFFCAAARTTRQHHSA